MTHARVPIIFMLPEFWPAVREIYRQGIATGNATFETELPDWEGWDSKHRKNCRFVAVTPIEEEALVGLNDVRVLGWAALSAVSTRTVYAGVAEVSVYVQENARGNGVGRSLLEALIAESELNGIWTLQAGIFPENMPSVALHKSCGFREVGVRQRVGKLGVTWRDVLLLERRSRQVGV
jgi:L-amino acid N-acyltransferase YncA